jgi:hypothetical protein
MSKFDEVCIELWTEYDDDSIGVLSAVDRLKKAHDLDIQEQDKHIAELEAENMKYWANENRHGVYPTKDTEEEELSDAICDDDDGCPTENGRLRKEWRDYKRCIAELEAEMDFLRGTMRARVSAIKFELKEQGITDYEGFAPSEVNYLQCIRAGFVKANKRVKELEAMNEDLRGRIDKLNCAEVEK